MPAEPHIATDAPADDDPAAPRWRRLAPVLALLVLAPWAAECSWGGFTLTNFLAVVIFLGPMYGGAAILIRETARHLGAGWPAIVLLAAAFGVLQAGLVDQSLFNPGYLDHTEYAGTAVAARTTPLPGMGVDTRQVIDFVGNHILLSMCAPIALVESFLDRARRSRPWLGRRGLAVVAVLYLLGSLLIFSDDGGRKGFLATPAQLVGAAALTLILVSLALLPRWRHGRRHPPVTDRMPAGDLTPAEQQAPAVGQPSSTVGPVPVGRAGAPRPLWVALLVLAAQLAVGLVAGWLGVAVALLAAATVGAMIVHWAGRAGWGQRHVLAAGTASLVSAAGFAYLVPPYAPATPAASLAGDLAVTVITAVLIGGAWWRLRRRTVFGRS
ncbi:hypothetical protein [Micromonospora sp. 067-2]|uniref:hypothetical protein n=1 Tax=Micromonospora sp. 067-2 TaxID=2789270 RepID=UPI00397890FB